MAPASGKQGFLPSFQIDDDNRSNVDGTNRMLDECDPVTSWREPRIGDRARGLEKNLANREFQAVLPRDISDYGETVPVGRPVGLLHVFEDLPRRLARERHPGQYSQGVLAVQEVSAERNCQLTRGRNRKEIGLRKRKHGRFGTLGARRKESHRSAVLGGAVNDRSSVWSKPRGPNGASTERELLK